MAKFTFIPRSVAAINLTLRPRVKFSLYEKGTALGTPGLSAYEVWLSQGNTGTQAEYLASLQGDDGQSAYEIWLANGNTGTEADFLTWLQSGGAVKSVNNKTGDVQLSAADVGAEPAKAENLDYVTTEEKTAISTIGNKVDKNGTDRLITEEEVTTFNAKQNALGFTPENSVNKQNSLTTDGSGNKFPTVDAVNSGLSAKENTGVASALITQLINGATTDYDTLKKLQEKIIAINSIIGGSAPDGDNIVNTVAELLAVFSTFPEGSDMVTLLTAKLSTSDVYNALDQLLAGKALDARQGKVLSDLCAGLRTDLTNHNHAGTYEPVIAPTVSTPADDDALLAKRGASWISLSFAAIKTALSSAFASITGSNTFVGVQSILGGLKVAKLYPSADSTTAVQVCKADGSTAVVTFDTTNGRVGVGTVAPNSKLNVIDGSVSELRFNSGAATLTPSLAVGNTNSTGKFAALLAGTSGAAFYFDNSGYFEIASAAKSDYTGNNLGGSGTSMLRISTSGNIGIGLTNPGYKLDVNGDINIPNGSIFRTSGIASFSGDSTSISLGSGGTARDIRLLNGTSTPAMFIGKNAGSYSGNAGIGTTTPTAKLSVAERTALNENGGIMVRLTNKTGATSVKGTVVYASPTTDNAFAANPVDGDMPFGIVYEAGIADGAECWVVVSGIAEVLMENNTAATRSYIAYSSAVTAGRIQLSASAPSAVTHFKEIGHTLESKAAGTNVLVKCILHFN